MIDIRRALALALVIAAPLRAGAQGPATPLVGAQWLARHIDDAGLVLLHVGDRAQYDREHIPGARFVAPRDLAVERDGLVLELPEPATLRERLEKLGIGDDSRVIVYFGEDWLTPATRVLFTLDAAGLGARSALLDGGMRAWKRAGGRVTAELPATKRGTLSVGRAPEMVVDAAWVRARRDGPGVAIVDARAEGFYDGSAPSHHRPGHIPGAKSIPFSSIATDSLTILPATRLAELFRAAGVQPGDTVVAYCHIGQQATAIVLAARVLGHPVKLYDGSFEDWSRRTELPVETVHR